LGEGGGGIIRLAADEVLGAEEVGKTGGGSAESREAGAPILDGSLLVVGEFKDPAHDNAEHGDFIIEAVKEGKFEVGGFEFIELAGIEAVFEGIGIAGLTTTETLWAGRFLIFCFHF